MTEIDDLLIERPDRLQLYKFNDLVNQAPAPWQIQGVFREQSVGLLYGRRGCYKSFIALDIAASLATGIPWQGHDIPIKGLVIYIAAEGGGGMVQRARAWAEQHAINPRDVNVLFVVEPAILTADSEDISILIHRIQLAIHWQYGFDEETGYDYEDPVAREWPKLIVVDTLARCFTGNENQQEYMGQFIQGVDRLKREFNSSVLILHHTGRDESHERGSTVLGGACDTIYRLDADADTQSLTLTNEKMKDGREPLPINLSYQEVTVKKSKWDSDEDLTSVIIVEAGQAHIGKTAQILAILDQYESLSWAEWLKVSGIPKPTFSKAIRILNKKGEIIKENGFWRKS